MDLIKTITKNVRTVLKNKIEEQAIENMLYAKIAHLFALKDVKFTSINNLKKPATLAYYAVNFISSGGSKNQAISTIDDCVLPFIKKEYERLDQEVADMMLEEELALLDVRDRNYAKEKYKLEKKYANGGVINFKTNGGTPAALYSKLEKIEKYKKGALFAQITEFSDYFRASVENSLSVNRSFLDCLNNLYEGLFEPSDSMGTSRKEIEGVAFSLLFMSDIEELLEPKNNNNFRRRLKSGYARRMNFYLNKDINYSKNPPARVSKEEKLDAYEQLKFCSACIQKIYEEMPTGMEFQFDDKANEALESWEETCQEEIAKFYQYSDRLSLENNIKKIEIENSTWKITKMAVLIQILEGKDFPFVTFNSVFRAIDFYKKCREALYQILGEHQITQESQLASYFLDHIGEPINKDNIKGLQLVNKDNFSRWYPEAIKDVQDILAEKGFELVCGKKNRNSQPLICQKKINPEETLINVSYSNDAAPHPAKDYEYVECTTDAFVSLILNSKALSARKFKDKYRNDQNACGVQNTLWLDIDDGMTIEEAKEMFKDYWYVMYTTPHHQKKKDEKSACDRFRVVFKVKEPMPDDIEEYKELMTNILAHFGSDPSCNNISRYYRGNPDAEFWVNREGDYFNWQEFVPKKVEKSIVIKPTKTKKYVGSKDETLNNDNIFTDLGERLLKSHQITKGNRDEALAYSVGVLISAVKSGELSHTNAKIWLDDKLMYITTSDFKDNARKYRNRLENLDFGGTKK